jgi:antitoxin (DNA-binding transcriptional repressor) of toxin-antitoxin stability system
MQEAKTRLSQLVAAAERGETVLLCRDGEAVAELRPLSHGLARTKVDTRDLGPPTSYEEAFAPLDADDWGGWTG